MTPRTRKRPTDIDNRAIMADLMRTFRRELLETVRPEVSAAYPAYVVDLMGMVLEYLEDWAPAAPYPDVDAARATLIGAFAGTAAGEQQYLPDLDDAAAVDESLAGVVQRASRANDATALATLGPAVAEISERLYSEQNRRLAASRGSERAILDEIYPVVTPARFAAYANARLGIADDQVVKVTEIPGGHSKDTYLIAFGSGREMIVRRDFPFGPTELSAPDEFGLLSRLSQLGLPVARPIAAEYDRSHLGQPFLVVEKVEGQNPLKLLDTEPGIGRAVSLDLARVLARLHQLDPAELGFPRSTASARDQVREYLGRWRRWWDVNRVHASSLVEAGFAWLERNVPEEIPRIVTVHGDARPDNMIVKDGRAAALLDWEFAHPGDPAEDLLYAKGFVEPFLAWEEFLREYREAGGASFSAGGARYYDIFRSLRNVVCCEVAWGGYVLGKFPAFKLVSQGIVFKRMIALELAKSLRQLDW